MDRIDMWVEVVHVPYDDLKTKNKGPKISPELKTKASQARKLAYGRLEALGRKPFLNNKLSSKDINDYFLLSKETGDILTAAASRLELSPRSYFKVIKLARTIADLENSKRIESPHILEALQYRPKI